MDFKEKITLRAGIHQAFSESAPIESQDLFAGRTRQIEKALGAVFGRGQHAIIFGEWGRPHWRTFFTISWCYPANRATTSVHGLTAPTQWDLTPFGIRLSVNLKPPSISPQCWSETAFHRWRRAAVSG